MALLGILSLFQIVLLPGALILSATDNRGTLLRRLLLAFGLSLIANYLVVFALAAAGLYTRTVVFVVFASEITALVWLNRARIRRWLLAPLFSTLIEPASAEIHHLRQVTGSGFANTVRRAATMVVLLGALVQIGLVLVAFAGNWGTIFTWVDAVFSWNRWAVAWSQNTLPLGTYHYPQLIPANWSISYVFMNVPLQYVARGMMPLFMLVLLVGMFHLGWSGRTVGLFAASITTPFLYERCRILMIEGGADLPLACMAFLSFFCLVAAKQESAAIHRTRYLVLGAALAAGAAVTKQPGLYFLAIYPVLAISLVLNNESRIGRAHALHLAALYFAIILVVVVPYYFYAESQIQAGLNKSEFAYVTQGIHQGASIPQRIVNASRLWVNNIGLVPTFLLVSFCLFSLGDRMSRWIVGFIVAPWWLLWAAFFSYDLRNLSMALPFLAMSVGTGAVAVGRILTGSPDPALRLGLRRLSQLQAVVIVAVAGALTAAAIVLGLHPSPDRLVAHHRRLERELGNSALNAQLYAQTAKPFSGVIVTDYVWLLRLPDLGDRCVLQDFIGNPEAILSSYQQKLTDPRISHFLLPANADPLLLRSVEEGLQRGDLKLLFSAEGYLFVEVVRRMSSGHRSHTRPQWDDSGS